MADDSLIEGSHLTQMNTKERARRMRNMLEKDLATPGDRTSIDPVGPPMQKGSPTGFDSAAPADLTDFGQTADGKIGTIDEIASRRARGKRAPMSMIAEPGGRI